MSYRQFAFVVTCLFTVIDAVTAADPVSGWRGNQTGQWPDAVTPIEWSRIPHGAMEGLRCARQQIEPGSPDAEVVEKGLLRQWLVVGPFSVKDSEADLDVDALGGEADVSPTAGGKVGEQDWKPLTSPKDDLMDFGTAEVPWLNLAKALGFKTNHVGYAHTWLHSPRGGAARIVADHGEGMKLWLNGREVYRQPKRVMGMGYYTNLSKLELHHLHQTSAQVDVELKPGWNRLLVKLSSPRVPGHDDMRCDLRIMDPADVNYETRNIRWMAELPARSTSTPILAGDRIVVMAEPDELLCFDRNSGKRLCLRR